MIYKTSHLLPLMAVAAGGSVLAADLSASVLNLDIGPGAAYVGDITPANAAGAIAGVQNFTAVNGDTTVSGFGTTIDLDFGRNSNGSQGTVSAASSVTSVNLPGGAGVFASDLANDALASFDLTSGTDRSPIGLEVGGLPDDDYVAFLVTYVGTYTEIEVEVYAGTAAAGDDNYSDNDFGGPFDPITEFAASTTRTTNAWVEGENFSQFDFTIAGGESLYIVVEDFTNNAAEDTVIAALQIVSASAVIPEPASALLLTGGLGLLLSRRRPRTP